MKKSGASTTTIPAKVAGQGGPGHQPADPTSSNPLHRLTPEQIQEIGDKFQAIHDDVRADLGERDATYIRNLITFHRRLAALSRIVLTASRYPPAAVVGTVGLSAAKIIENMEIGHNVLHGQWDWMNDPQIHSSTWDWDTASTAASWKHSHNYVHHTFTNIVGKDKDVGYEIFRVDAKQKWEPLFLTQPFTNILLMVGFEWGVALHDLDLEAIRKGKKSKKQLAAELKDIGRKAGRQVLKDYIVFPALSGRHWKTTLKANILANIVRNVWSNAIIFCGHFPDQAYTFTEEEVEGETRGGWYVRQLLGAANIEGSDTFHLMSGNLSYQVEHHLFPDLPSSRYKEIAPRVKKICEEYGLPYNTGPFLQQWLMVQRTILRLAFPSRKDFKRKGQPYVAPPAPPKRTEGTQPGQPGGALPAFP